MVLSISTEPVSHDAIRYLSPPHTSSTLSSSSFSSSSTLSDVSPLPSPSLPSSKSKTSSFFGSSWLAAPSSPPPKRPHSPSAPRRAASESSQDGVPAGPASAAAAAAAADANAPERSRSLNLRFFSAQVSLPTPPPSSCSASSRESSPPARPAEGKPRLARLFPSRYVAPPTREFLDLDQTPRPIDAMPVLSMSPTAAESPAILIDRSHLGRRAASTPTPLPLSAPTRPFAPEPLVEREENRAELEDSAPATPVAPGAVVRASSGPAYELQRELGRGAFSSVWLARDLHDSDSEEPLPVSASILATSRRLDGTKPQTNLHARKSSDTASERSVYFDESAGAVDRPRDEKRGGVVAVKMTDRKLCEVNDRTRVSFVREVEVLRHVSHRSIVSYVASFSTRTHHCLVLEHVGGGELFDLVLSDARHAALGEAALRRIWGELCKAVGWMHAVGLVHRDIKLENILLTRDPLASPLPPASQPLLKLTDFGLARFVDSAQPLLQTRCGSESYAAPELVTGRRYDGRQTDAWACGVVLYALAARALPFDVVRGAGGEPETPARKRRKMLVRIANGDYEWPVPADAEDSADEFGALERGERQGMDLARSPGVRRTIGKLLVRDPAQRAAIVDLWDDEWMWGTGAPVAPASASRQGSLKRHGSRRRRADGAVSRQSSLRSANGSGDGEVPAEEEMETPTQEVVVDMGGEEGEESEVEVEEHGVLVDGDSIDDIARQELR